MKQFDEEVRENFNIQVTDILDSADQTPGLSGNQLPLCSPQMWVQVHQWSFPRDQGTLHGPAGLWSANILVIFISSHLHL